jgi:hypothetical protein
MVVLLDPARSRTPPGRDRHAVVRGRGLGAGPELVLLFKAKAARPKDQADFDGTVPQLTAAQRATLAELLARVHPGHPWLVDL